MFSQQLGKRSAMISVIVPTKNEAGVIEELLLSLKDVDYQPEIIVVDSASTDKTAEIAKRHVVVIHANVNGRGAAMDLGANRAKGDTLLFLHSDTRLPGNAFQHLCLYVPYCNRRSGHFLQTFFLL